MLKLADVMTVKALECCAYWQYVPRCAWRTQTLLLLLRRMVEGRHREEAESLLMGPGCQCPSWNRTPSQGTLSGTRFHTQSTARCPKIMSVLYYRTLLDLGSYFYLVCYKVHCDHQVDAIWQKSTLLTQHFKLIFTDFYLKEYLF